MSDKVTSTDIKIALSHKHIKDFFLTECKSGSTWFTVPGDMKILDALAIRKSWANPCFTGYEIKVSRGDFLRDSKFYRYEEICNCLYLVCPKGMIDRTELPESVGLMVYDPDKKTLTTRKKAIYREITYSPDLLLYIIYSRLDSDRYPFFDSKRKYFEEYVAQKKNSKDLAYYVRTRLVQENEELIKQVEALGHFREEYDKHRAIMKVLEKYNIWSFRGDTLAAALDKRLSRTVPEDISSVRHTLEAVVERLKRMEEATAGKEAAGT